MKNKIMSWIFALLICLAPALAFTPYNCENTANIYDDFADNSINDSKWITAVIPNEIINEIDNRIVFDLPISTTAPWGNLSTNISLIKPTLRNKWGVVSRNGCIKFNMSGLYGTGGTGNKNVTFKLINSTATKKILFTTSITTLIQSATLEIWRDTAKIYYRTNTSANTSAILYNFTASEIQNYFPQITLESTGIGVSALELNLTNVWINSSVLIINVTDETTGNLITTDLTIQKTDNISTITLNHINITLLSNYDRVSQIHFSGSPYADRTYNLPAPTSEVTYLNAYLTNTSLPNVALRTFTVSDGSPNVLENVQFVISKLYGTTLVQLSNPLTNFQGQVQEYMDSSTNYNFNITKSGYQNKTFNLYPADVSYLVILYSTQTFQFNNTQGDITYSIAPVGSVLATADTSNFTLTTNSPSGYLTNFGVSFNGTQNVSSTTTGGVTTLTLNTTPFENQTITIKYFMNTSGGLQELNQSYYLYNMAYGGNTTAMGIFSGLVPQINPLYRFFIAIFVSLIVGAGFFVLIGPLGASGFAAFIFLAFGFSGFIPWYLPTITVILVVLGYIAVGGPDGT